jgi:hypothetical protein
MTALRLTEMVLVRPTPELSYGRPKNAAPQAPPINALRLGVGRVKRDYAKVQQ